MRFLFEKKILKKFCKKYKKKILHAKQKNFKSQNIFYLVREVFEKIRYSIHIFELIYYLIQQKNFNQDQFYRID